MPPASTAPLRGAREPRHSEAGSVTPLLRSPNAGGVPHTAPPGLLLAGEIGPHGAGRTQAEGPKVAKPVLVIYCTICCTPYLLDLARRREAEGLPVEYHIHPLCQEWADAWREAACPPPRTP